MIEISKFDSNNPRFLEILNRGLEDDSETMTVVSEIIRNVRKSGDEALFGYMQKFDHVDYSAKSPKVSEEEIIRAKKAMHPEFLDAVDVACKNIREYHQKQLPSNYSICTDQSADLARNYYPIESVGVCVPAATAPLVSSLYMNLIPALVAEVPRIVVISAPRSGKVEDEIVAVASHLGVHEIYGISGAQGVAALAYGTNTIPKVDKIVGPGSIWVSTAKKLVYGAVGIDSLAGPSEIVIFADESANSDYVAIDLLSQAEHGTGLEASIAFVTSETKAMEVKESLDTLVERYQLEDAVRESLSRYGNIFVVDQLTDAIPACELMAPEHIELLCQSPEEISDGLKKYGALFIGQWTPEAVGDYFAGSNHILPTQGAARFSSGLTVSDFMRSSATVRYTKEALICNADKISRLALAENMRAHQLSVHLRVEPTVCQKN